MHVLLLPLLFPLPSFPPLMQHLPCYPSSLIACPSASSSTVPPPPQMPSPAPFPRQPVCMSFSFFRAAVASQILRCTIQRRKKGEGVVQRGWHDRYCVQCSGGRWGCLHRVRWPSFLPANAPHSTLFPILISHFRPHLQHRILLGLECLQLLDVCGVAPVLTPQLDNLGGRWHSKVTDSNRRRQATGAACLVQHTGLVIDMFTSFSRSTRHVANCLALPSICFCSATCIGAGGGGCR